MLHFIDGRSQHWKHESFSIVRDRESGPIRLLRGNFPQETLEIPDQGFASVLEQKGLSEKRWRTSWKQKSNFCFCSDCFVFRNSLLDPRSRTAWNHKVYGSVDSCFSGRTTGRNGSHSAFSESANMLNLERGQCSGNAHAFPDSQG